MGLVGLAPVLGRNLAETVGPDSNRHRILVQRTLFYSCVKTWRGAVFAPL